MPDYKSFKCAVKTHKIWGDISTLQEEPICELWLGNSVVNKDSPGDIISQGRAAIRCGDTQFGWSMDPDFLSQGFTFRLRGLLYFSSLGMSTSFYMEDKIHFTEI